MPWSTKTLANGHKIPEIAFGTWTSGSGQDAITQVNQAIDAGFTHIDTAQAYGNEPEVGQALTSEHAQPWITTKWSGRKSMNDSLADSLEWLGVHAVDLYLIHSPRICGDDIPSCWEDFLRLKGEKKTRESGVSNFKVEHLEEIRNAGLEMPAANQIILHPLLDPAETKAQLAYHAKHDIVTEAYSPLWPLTHNAEGPLIPKLMQVADKHHVEPEQVLLAWARAKGAVAVTNTSRKDRLERYIAAGDLELSSKDIKAIDHAGHPGHKGSMMDKAGMAAPIGLAVLVLVLAITWFWRRQKSNKPILGRSKTGYQTIPQEA